MDKLGLRGRGASRSSSSSAKPAAAPRARRCTCRVPSTCRAICRCGIRPRERWSGLGGSDRIPERLTGRSGILRGKARGVRIASEQIKCRKNWICCAPARIKPEGSTSGRRIMTRTLSSPPSIVTAIAAGGIAATAPRSPTHRHPSRSAVRPASTSLAIDERARRALTSRERALRERELGVVQNPPRRAVHRHHRNRRRDWGHPERIGARVGLRRKEPSGTARTSSSSSARPIRTAQVDPVRARWRRRDVGRLHRRTQTSSTRTRMPSSTPASARSTASTTVGVSASTVASCCHRARRAMAGRSIGK